MGKFISTLGIIMACALEVFAVEEDWMGIYIKGVKVGYTVSKTIPEKNGYQIRERTLLKLSIGGEEKFLKSLIVSRADKDYLLQSFRFKLSSTEQTMSAEGKIKGKNLFLTSHIAGQTQETTIPLGEGAFLPASIESIVAKKGLRIGKEYKYQIFDPTTFMPCEITIKLGKKEIVSIHGKRHQARKVTLGFLNTESYLWINDDGKVLKEEAPGDIVMIREDKKQAIGFEKGEFLDLFSFYSMYSVSCNRSLPNPRKATFLRAKLKGSPQHESVLKITRGMEKKGEFLPADLGPTPFIQSDHRQIVAQARKIVGNTRSSLEKVRKINTWVYKNIQKSPTFSIPSALDVLKNKKGDCNEHSILFCALARAAGVPARVCLGLVYMDGVFYYHAWNRVWLNGSWVSVDPVFNQVKADATHLKLAEGVENQGKLIGFLGKLQIEVLEYR